MATESYYAGIRRKYMEAAKSHLKDPDPLKHGIKSGDDVILDEEPENPEEMLQYVEFIQAFRDKFMNYDLLVSNASSLIGQMQRRFPDSPELKQARDLCGKGSIRHKVPKVLFVIGSIITIAVGLFFFKLYTEHPWLYVIDNILSIL